MREKGKEREEKGTLGSIEHSSSLFAFFFDSLLSHNTSTTTSCPLGAYASADNDLLLSDVDPSGPLQRAVASSEMPDAFAVGFVKGKKKEEEEKVGLSFSLLFLSLSPLPPRLVPWRASPLSLTHEYMEI